MRSIYLVKTGETLWRAEKRFDLACGAPLTEGGIETVSRIGKTLVPHEPKFLYCGPAESEEQTAKLLAKELKLRPKTSKSLTELDFGLWQGLTLEELKHRQPKMYRQWTDSPEGIRPPEGESLPDAQNRLCLTIARCLKNSSKGPSVFVLRPIAFGLVRCRLEKRSLNDLWELNGADVDWIEEKFDPSDLVP